MLLFVFFHISDGFRKIVDPKTGGLKNEKDQWEFFHPHFSKATPDDLAKIKRKVFLL